MFYTSTSFSDNGKLIIPSLGQYLGRKQFEKYRCRLFFPQFGPLKVGTKVLIISGWECLNDTVIEIKQRVFRTKEGYTFYNSGSGYVSGKGYVFCFLLDKEVLNAIRYYCSLAEIIRNYNSIFDSNLPEGLKLECSFNVSLGKYKL